MHIIFISHVFTAAAPNASAKNNPNTALRILSELNTEPFYVNLLLNDANFLQQELGLWSVIYGCNVEKKLSPVAIEQFKSFIATFSFLYNNLDMSGKEKVDFKLKTQDEIEAHYENVFSNMANPPTSADNSITLKFVYYNLLKENIFIHFEEESKHKTLTRINALDICFK